MMLKLICRTYPSVMTNYHLKLRIFNLDIFYVHYVFNIARTRTRTRLVDCYPLLGKDGVILIKCNCIYLLFCEHVPYINNDNLIAGS